MLINKLHPKNEEGFTLVELLVVIIIIGILAAIALPIFLNQQKQAADAATKSDMKTVALAQQTYITKNPSSFGTVSKTEMAKLAPNLSDMVIIGTWVSDGKGFCVVGQNSVGEFDGGRTNPAVGKYLWYDSALGGWIKNNTTGNPTPSGACAVSPRPAQVWYYGPENPDKAGIAGWR